MNRRLIVLFVAALLVACQTNRNPISVEEARKSQNGKPLSVQAGTKDCSFTSMGITPLNDLGTGTYQGFQGGLYPGGSNTMPASHLNLGLSLASQVMPLNTNGVPDAFNGKIVLISVGVSNTRIEFSGQIVDGGPVVYTSAFMPLADADPDKNSKVVIVNGSQGGEPITNWLNSNDPTWNEVDNQLAAAGVTPSQVQVAWVKLPEINPTEPFPTNALTYKSDLETVLRNLKIRYPNARLAYLSSRIYGAYNPTSNNREPYSYEHGFGTKWTIDDQITAQGNINPDPALGPVVAPWIAWGPYIWADGIIPRSDGLIYECSDFDTDGTHPVATGVEKVATRLLAHFKTDPTACSWFLANACGNQRPVANAGMDKTVTDVDGNGSESVTLNGSGSTDADGSIVSYEWKEGATVLGTGATLSANFGVGVHTVILTVTDNGGAISADHAIITVNAPVAAVTFDAASSANTGSSTSGTLTWSHPVTSSGANRILVVGVTIRNDQSQTVSSINYGGSNLSLIQTAAKAKDVRVELWYLKNPPVGTNNVVVTLAGSKKACFAAGAMSYTGVNQTTPFGTPVTSNKTGTSISINVASAAGEVVVDVAGKQYNSDSFTAGVGQTARWTDKTWNSTLKNNVTGGGSEKPGAATVTMLWNSTTSRSWAIVAVPLKP